MIAGKWQLNGVNTKEEGCMDVNRPHQFGFDEHCLWWMTSKGSRYVNPRIVRNGETLETTNDDYGPDIVSDHILDFIDKNNGEPFFVYYPMLLVHAPFQPTPDSPEWDMPGKRSENNIKYFKDMVEYTDKVIAKILNKLDELNLTENTMVIFIGDNGTNSKITTQTNNGPYKGGKGHLLDNGTHVPMIVRWPAGGAKGGATSDLIEFSDFVPTFVDAVHAKLPQNINGRSFYNLPCQSIIRTQGIYFYSLLPNYNKSKRTQWLFYPDNGLQIIFRW